MERREYRMTRRELQELERLSRPVTLSGLRWSPEAWKRRREDHWKALGEKYGFEWRTARPAPGKNRRCFTAVPLEEETDGNELDGYAEEHGG